VRGKEDGLQAVDFENWLLPYDAVIQALKFNTQVLPDGQVELRSPGVVTRIDLKKLRTDPELGLVFSIKELQTLFGVTAEFDINQYAVQLNAPWLNQSSQNQQIERPVEIEGLPRIHSPNINVAAIEQRANVSGSLITSPTAQGDLTTVGTVFGGSWFVRVNQPDITQQQTWQIGEAQFQRQTNLSDYIIGSQSPFWRSLGAGDYWGFTTIQRRGFIPLRQFSGGFDPQQRLQAAQIGRTISGRTEPGTLVRLVQGFGDIVRAEVLVDSSGVYRFENIPFDNQSGNNYRVFLYPQGRLTAQPSIQAASFSPVPGQIPVGASALIVSGGWRREFSQAHSLLGNFSDFRGGVAQRWGLSEDLTVGLGGIYDRSFRGLGELFFEPKDFPLKVAVSALAGNRLDLNTDVAFAPSPSFNARFNSDQFSSRLNLNWQVSPGITLFGIYNSRDAAAIGGQLILSGRKTFTLARVTLDTQNHFRWNFFQRLDKLELGYSGNEVGSLASLSYRLTPETSTAGSHALTLNYESRNLNGSNNNLLTLFWNYRSKQGATGGNYLLETQVGYGIGSLGTGFVATIGTTLIPGLLLRGRYQGVSLTSGEPTFNIELVSSLNLQRGITTGDRRSEDFRTQGGLLIQPFFDRNNNGKRDAGEEFYTETPELLLLINNKTIKEYQPEVKGDRILVRLPPGTYRLDFDPAGFPPDWQATVDALAIEVVAGSYTPVSIPLVPSYTRSGIVTDAQGKLINGARIEAVSTSGYRVFSVTNGAGIYYLERLRPGNYSLQINSKPAQPGTLNLEKSAEAFQELNLQQP